MTIKEARKIIDRKGKLSDDQIQEYINTASLLSDMFFGKVASIYYPKTTAGK